MWEFLLQTMMLMLSFHGKRWGSWSIWRMQQQAVRRFEKSLCRMRSWTCCVTRRVTLHSPCISYAGFGKLAQPHITCIYWTSSLTAQYTNGLLRNVWTKNTVHSLCISNVVRSFFFFPCDCSQWILRYCTWWDFHNHIYLHCWWCPRDFTQCYKKETGNIILCQFSPGYADHPKSCSTWRSLWGGMSCFSRSRFFPFNFISSTSQSSCSTAIELVMSHSIDVDMSLKFSPSPKIRSNLAVKLQ